MKPRSELNRRPVLVSYWVLFGEPGNCGSERGSAEMGFGPFRAAMSGKKPWDAGRQGLELAVRDAPSGVMPQQTHTSGEPCRMGRAGP
jgi:hypothetical protein